jgi:hypothetical protein
MLWIPDFPVFADPYIGMEDDYRKGRRAERAADSDFRTLVNYYWSITPDTPLEMAERFNAQAVAVCGAQSSAAGLEPATESTRSKRNRIPCLPYE